MQSILNALTINIGANILGETAWQTFQNKAGFRARQVDHLKFLVDTNAKKTNIEELQNALILAKITKMCYFAIIDPEKSVENSQSWQTAQNWLQKFGHTGENQISI